MTMLPAAGCARSSSRILCIEWNEKFVPLSSVGAMKCSRNVCGYPICTFPSVPTTNTGIDVVVVVVASSAASALMTG
jgi:hypothetical protein